ncbi:von Willebrand factor type A domain-containing protein [Devosia oryziradicis]|uniref:von Willebrand factor type A domain-containing protein n=2 Tax=Devosia oryziradicis TaxID=2801335 RepID=A0ABX7BZ54_9HYPH|nr:von Willebrand factor type A domain-containing protein [Devosia oryziradicis]
MSNDDMHDPFEQLKGAQAPDPRAEARKRAMAAGMAAFEAANKKTSPAAQGSSWGQRLTSIITSWKGKSIMDMRLPIGTAAIALLILPLGYQLYSTTSMTPADAVPPRPVTSVEPPPVEQGVETQAEQAVDAVANSTASPMTVTPVSPGTEAAAAGRDESVVAPEPVPMEEMAPDLDSGLMDTEVARQQAPMVGGTVAPQQAPAGAAMAESGTFMAAPAPMPPTVAQPTQPSGDEFTGFEEQRLRAVAEEPVSTFSIDVDTASYSYVRRMIEDGYLPEPDAVRIEEMINYFPYDYAPADSASVPFKPTMAVYPTPWNPKTQLLHIGIKGYVPPVTEDKASNLVFLIDTSGSMDEPDKLPLLKRAFALLVDQLSANDTVSIVVYAGSAGVVLEPTPATEQAKILAALDNLSAGGSTAGAEGIELAYRLAEQAKVEGGTNRVILATDGDFNVGIDNPEDLENFIKAKRDSGVTLSVLGFGQGNLDDATMQALAQNGNGNASYISSFREAQKVLVEEMGGTLEMIAKDVKIQIEFNPAMVAEYRLIGYETRALNREDFNNDKVDAGDIGAGHTVTAIYEITPVGSGAGLVDPLRYGAEEPVMSTGQEIAFLKMRYKLPESDVSQLIEQPVTPSVVYGDIGEVSDDMRFAAAVAAYGQKLKGSNYGGEMSWSDIAALARSGKGEDESGYRAEFIQLIKTTALLQPDTVDVDTTRPDPGCIMGTTGECAPQQ